MRTSQAGLRARWTGFDMARGVALLFLAVLGLVATTAGASAARCDALANLRLPETDVTSAQVVTGGSFTPTGGTAITGLPDFCRVVAVAHPTAQSAIGFEVWLPLVQWNGKFQGVGNGGLAGVIVYGALAQAVQQGYAAASTDDGHAGSDPTWLGNPEKFVDFGTRAVHLTAIHAKELITGFYGKAASQSYFVGCSEGGREAWMEAQRFPSDYDGIIAGDPFNFASRTVTGQLYISSTMLKDAESGLPLDALTTLHNAVLAACDGADGVVDGVLANPPRCRFDPNIVLCQTASSTNCLTAAQIDTVTSLYAGLRFRRTGDLIYPGQVVGGESIGGVLGWYIYQLGIPLQSFSQTILPYAVFHDPNWDYRTFDFERDTRRVDRAISPAWDATSPQLDAFRRRGGKLIAYHGYADWLITPYVSTEFYRAVVEQNRDASSFYRLFMAPGVGHCTSGPGPNAFGLPGQPVVANDADHSVIAALDRWVTNGIAPRKIIATKFVSDDSTKGVQTTRPLCPYPQVAKYAGAGSTNDAASFRCVGELGEPRDRDPHDRDPHDHDDD